MTQEDKELLLKYLCMALPYGVVLNIREGFDLKLDMKYQGIGVLYPEDCSDEFNKRNGNQDYYITISGCYYGEDIKPYLRPMSSMTEEEFEEYGNIIEHISIGSLDFNIANPNVFDWLNAHHFDYRGLIPKGLAIEVTEENNPYKN